MADYVSRFKGTEIDDGVEKGISVGDVLNITTVEKGSVVGAINEVLDASINSGINTNCNLFEFAYKSK